MKHIAGKLKQHEFHYRIFVSLGIVAIGLLASFLLYKNEPSTIIRLGSYIGLEEQTARTVGYAFLAVVALSSSLLRMWAGSVLSSHRIMSFKVQVDKLLTKQPYGIVRNPIYLADLIAVSSFSLCLPPIGLIIPLLFYIHYIRLITYEELSIQDNFGKAYTEYKERVPRIFPSFSSLRSVFQTESKFHLNKDGIRHNALFVLFVPGFIVASITQQFSYALLIGLPGVLDWAIIHTVIGAPSIISKKKAVFEDILYAQCWEDPQIDRVAFNIKENDVIFTITSGGCNALTFLLDNPSQIISVDLNRYQNFLLELKIASFQLLSYDELLEFIGVRNSTQRNEYYSRIKNNLTSDARAYWDNQEQKITSGIIHCGRYERYMALLRSTIGIIIGKRKIRTLFSLQTKQERKMFFIQDWKNIRWWFFTRVMLSRTMMSLLFDKAFFAQLDKTFSFGKNFSDKFERATTELPLCENYFLSYILLGKYYNEEHLPVYLRKEHFESIKNRVNRIEIITGSCEDILQKQKNNSISAFNITNIFEWMPMKLVEHILRECIRTGKQDAVLTYRNLLVPRQAPSSLAQWIRPDNTKANELHQRDLSFIYDAYVVEHLRKENDVCLSSSMRSITIAA